MISAWYIPMTKIENNILFDPTGIITLPSFHMFGERDYIF